MEGNSDFNSNINVGCNPISSCFECNKRSVGCHSVCIDYIAEKARYEQQKAKVQNAKKQTFVLKNGDYVGDSSAFKRLSDRQKRIY